MVGLSAWRTSNGGHYLRDRVESPAPWSEGDAGVLWMVREGIQDVTATARVIADCRLVNENDLIQKCRAGERDAQRELFAQTSGRIYRLLLRMTGNPDDASDLTQETYVKGLGRLDQFDGRCAIASWLYRIALNEALQHRRRKGIERTKLQALALQRTTETHEPTTELRLDLEDALIELPSDDRTVLLLRYQEALDYRGMAEVLECAEGTVASRLNRARERLRAILRKSYG